MNDKYHMIVQNMFVPKLSHDALSLETSTLAEQQLLWKDIKAMAASSESLPLLSKVGVGTVIGIGAGLSAGYIMMAFRWGALITSSLVTFPVWQWVDPLPILESVSGKSNRQKFSGENELDANSPLDESLETLMT
jgi:ABC-type nitrate/sulfonate/bicarbonate transport system permease component